MARAGSRGQYYNSPMPHAIFFLWLAITAHDLARLGGPLRMLHQVAPVSRGVIRPGPDDGRATPNHDSN